MMSWLRRFVLELWVMLAVAAVVGFMGPFGTYLSADFPHRVGTWWMQLMGAYVVIRPAIELWGMLARATALPARMIQFWGVALTSLPLAWLWGWWSRGLFHTMGGFAGILPFALLCAVAMLGVVWWAQRADAYLLGSVEHAPPADDPVPDPPLPDPVAPAPVEASPAAPRLLARLSPRFQGPVLALQSEDHYVRVHGTAASELVLIRLRDAIAEMDGLPGAQVHRSWWVAREAIAGIQTEGRAKVLVLTGGLIVPVARDSIDRLSRAGFLPVSSPAG
jgi:hypothetical protein